MWRQSFVIAIWKRRKKSELQNEKVEPWFAGSFGARGSDGIELKQSIDTNPAMSVAWWKDVREAKLTDEGMILSGQRARVYENLETERQEQGVMSEKL